MDQIEEHFGGRRKGVHVWWICVVGFVNLTLDMFVLVGGLEHFLFFRILEIIIPTDQYFSEG